MTADIIDLTESILEPSDITEAVQPTTKKRRIIPTQIIDNDTVTNIPQPPTLIPSAADVYDPSKYIHIDNNTNINNDVLNDTDIELSHNERLKLLLGDNEYIDATTSHQRSRMSTYELQQRIIEIQYELSYIDIQYNNILQQQDSDWKQQPYRKQDN